MFPCGWFVGTGFWWIFPIIMIAMIALCLFTMGRRAMACRTGWRARGEHRPSDGHDPSSR